MGREREKKKSEILGGPAEDCPVEGCPLEGSPEGVSGRSIGNRVQGSGFRVQFRFFGTQKQPETK